MSDLGRPEAVKKQPKKKKKEGEVLSKPSASKLSAQKKPKKKSDVEEVLQASESAQPQIEDIKDPLSPDMVKDTKEQEVEDAKDDPLKISEQPKLQPVDEGPLEKAPAEVENDKKVDDVKENVQDRIEEIRNKIQEVRVVNNVEKEKAIVVHTPKAVQTPVLCGMPSESSVPSSKMMSVKFEFDSKGDAVILFQSYKFYRTSYNKLRRTYIWNCVDRRCKAKIHVCKDSNLVLKEVSSHNHHQPSLMQANSNIKKECLYKILVIGELGTGKTSIIKRYVHQFFSQHYRATIGVDFALKVLNWDQNTIIRLQLWDIAGQERFGNMTRVYYKEAVGAFIVFDVTRASTFDAVVKWKQDLDAKVQLADGSPIPCVLLANKCDQQKEGLVNNPNKMNEYCEEYKFSAWFETSAKENINIEEAAKTLVDQIVRNDSSNENGRGGSRDSSKFPLESSEDFSEGKSCAC